MKRGESIFYIRGNHAQVWIETVIYVLIGFVMIGLILSYAKPKIEELQDRAILEQSTNMLKEIDSIVLTMGAAGNQRIIEISIKKGALKLDCVNDKMIFEMESKSVYSEPEKEISDGSITVLTQEQTGTNLVTLTKDFSDNYDLQFEGNDELKILSKTATPYKLSILNEGEIGGKNVLNLSFG